MSQKVSSPKVLSLLSVLVQSVDYIRDNKEARDRIEKFLKELNSTELKIAMVILGEAESEDEDVLRVVKDYKDWVESLRNSTRPSND